GIDDSDFTMKRSEVGTIKRKELEESITGEEIVTAGFIGAGLFATGTILSTLKKMKNIRLKGLATATGYKGHHVSKKFGFEYFTTNYKEIFKDKDINLVFIMTRHGSH
ncbi:MAG: Gfo/Idh/MocA family oxidoreductase, partial [Promethearchaeota archaeon]